MLLSPTLKAWLAIVGENLYAVDYWYRQKFNIAFGSTEHRQCLLSDMLAAWNEQKMIELMTKEMLQEPEPEPEPAKIEASEKHLKAEIQNRAEELKRKAAEKEDDGWTELLAHLQ